MAPQAMSGYAQTMMAMGVDRDDPFLGRRMSSHAAHGVPGQYDFTRSRRHSAPISDRFTLTKRKA